MAEYIEYSDELFNKTVIERNWMNSPSCKNFFMSCCMNSDTIESYNGCLNKVDKKCLKTPVVSTKAGDKSSTSSGSASTFVGESSTQLQTTELDIKSSKMSELVSSPKSVSSSFRHSSVPPYQSSTQSESLQSKDTTTILTPSASVKLTSVEGTQSTTPTTHVSNDVPTNSFAKTSLSPSDNSMAQSTELKPTTVINSGLSQSSSDELQTSEETSPKYPSTTFESRSSSYEPSSLNTLSSSLVNEYDTTSSTQGVSSSLITMSDDDTTKVSDMVKVSKSTNNADAISGTSSNAMDKVLSTSPSSPLLSSTISSVVTKDLNALPTSAYLNEVVASELTPTSDSSTQSQMTFTSSIPQQSSSKMADQTTPIINLKTIHPSTEDENHKTFITSTEALDMSETQSTLKEYPSSLATQPMNTIQSTSDLHGSDPTGSSSKLNQDETSTMTSGKSTAPFTSPITTPTMEGGYSSTTNILSSHGSSPSSSSVSLYESPTSSNVDSSTEIKMEQSTAKPTATMSPRIISQSETEINRVSTPSTGKGDSTIQQNLPSTFINLKVTETSKQIQDEHSSTPQSFIDDNQSTASSKFLADQQSSVSNDATTKNEERAISTTSSSSTESDSRTNSMSSVGSTGKSSLESSTFVANTEKNMIGGISSSYSDKKDLSTTMASKVSSLVSGSTASTLGAHFDKVSFVPTIESQTSETQTNKALDDSSTASSTTEFVKNDATTTSVRVVSEHTELSTDMTTPVKTSKGSVSEVKSSKSFETTRGIPTFGHSDFTDAQLNDGKVSETSFENPGTTSEMNAMEKSTLDDEYIPSTDEIISISSTVVVDEAQTGGVTNGKTDDAELASSASIKYFSSSAMPKSSPATLDKESTIAATSNSVDNGVTSSSSSIGSSRVSNIDNFDESLSTQSFVITDKLNNDAQTSDASMAAETEKTRSGIENSQAITTTLKNDLKYSSPSSLSQSTANVVETEPISTINLIIQPSSEAATLVTNEQAIENVPTTSSMPFLTSTIKEVTEMKSEPNNQIPTTAEISITVENRASTEILNLGSSLPSMTLSEKNIISESTSSANPSHETTSDIISHSVSSISESMSPQPETTKAFVDDNAVTTVTVKINMPIDSTENSQTQKSSESLHEKITTVSIPNEITLISHGTSELTNVPYTTNADVSIKSPSSEAGDFSTTKTLGKNDRTEKSSSQTKIDTLITTSDKAAAPTQTNELLATTNGIVVATDLSSTKTEQVSIETESSPSIGTVQISENTPEAIENTVEQNEITAASSDGTVKTTVEGKIHSSLENNADRKTTKPNTQAQEEGSTAGSGLRSASETITQKTFTTPGAMENTNSVNPNDASETSLVVDSASMSDRASTIKMSTVDDTDVTVSPTKDLSEQTSPSSSFERSVPTEATGTTMATKDSTKLEPTDHASSTWKVSDNIVQPKPTIVGISEKYDDRSSTTMAYNPISETSAQMSNTTIVGSQSVKPISKAQQMNPTSVEPLDNENGQKTTSDATPLEMSSKVSGEQNNFETTAPNSGETSNSEMPSMISKSSSGEESESAPTTQDTSTQSGEESTIKENKTPDSSSPASSTENVKSTTDNAHESSTSSDSSSTSSGGGMLVIS